MRNVFLVPCMVIWHTYCEGRIRRLTGIEGDLPTTRQAAGTDSLRASICRPSHSQCLPPPNQMGCHHLSPSQSIHLPPPPPDLVRLLYPIPSGCIRIYLLYLRHLHMFR
ncbi:solute carrier family 10 (sodium/bile acid cotransporter), member 7 [Cryptococcus neoformans Bt120]|nr:solute carrier family 10 (sodium/bile acid cotransporter), member 7 [Cryptococcus neoformans var. grubii Bt120]